MADVVVTFREYFGLYTGRGEKCAVKWLAVAIESRANGAFFSPRGTAPLEFV